MRNSVPETCHPKNGDLNDYGLPDAGYRAHDRTGRDEALLA
jgi:hypothetical protein